MTNRIKRIQTLANKITTAQRRIDNRKGRAVPVSGQSYEERITASRQYAASVLRKFRTKHPALVKLLLSSNSI